MVLFYVITMFVTYVVYRYIIIPIYLCCSGPRGERESTYNEVVDRDDHSDDVYKEFNIISLKYLYVRASKEYE